MPPKSRLTSFQRSHPLKYGVKVSQRSTSNADDVLAAECLFCVFFGREEKPGSKRTVNVKYFKKPFRTDNYIQHNVKQHPEKWKQYSEASEEEKKYFFDSVVPVKETLHAFFGSKQVTQIFLINAPIVKVIIGEMLWDPDEEGITHERMMDSFGDLHDSSENVDGSGDVRYSIVIKNKIQWQLAIDYLAASCSFRQAAKIMQSTKERTGLASIGNCSQLTIAKYARFACAINLQKLADLLEDSWAFAAAMDMSTHFSTGYLDIRIRLHSVKHGIVNAHVLSIPIFERHTGLVIFNTASKAFDAVHSQWRDKIVGIATDGEQKMTGRLSGVATRFKQVSKPGFIRVWCGAHQLDIVLQRVYSAFGDDQFYTQLTSLISYLRRQFNLIHEMKSKAPTLSDTRWESMHGVSKWFKTNRVRIDAYLDEKSPACTPPPKWWAQVMVIAAFSFHATICFKCLQGHTITVSAQRSHIDDLIEVLIFLVGCKGPLSSQEVSTFGESQWTFSRSKSFAVPADKVQDFIFDQGSFVADKLEGLDESELSAFVRDVGALFVEAIDGIYSICTERGDSNGPAEVDSQLPPVLPRDIASIRHKQFCGIVRVHRDRLLSSWTAVDIDTLEQQHQELQYAVRSESVLKDAIEACDDKTPFLDCWKILNGRFPLVERFCGGLATVFPGTSQVESDFSSVKAAKDVFKMRLTDLSLEGVIHAKQIDTLMKI